MISIKRPPLTDKGLQGNKLNKAKEQATKEEHAERPAKLHQCLTTNKLRSTAEENKMDPPRQGLNRNLTLDNLSSMSDIQRPPKRDFIAENKMRVEKMSKQLSKSKEKMAEEESWKSSSQHLPGKSFREGGLGGLFKRKQTN